VAYWYNVDSSKVEQDGETDPKANLLGPFDTEDEARNALQHAAERTAAWDEQDKEWNDDK
jgi:hypothetical protein